MTLRNSPLIIKCGNIVIHIFIHINYVLCEYCVNIMYNIPMKKLDEIKIRIAPDTKEAFKKACGRRGMSKVLDDFIKLYTKGNKQ